MNRLLPALLALLVVCVCCALGTLALVAVLPAGDLPVATPAATATGLPAPAPTAVRTATPAVAPSAGPSVTPPQLPTQTPLGTATPTASRQAPTPIVMPHATVVYYNITGFTESALRSQMDALGPEGFDAYTKWSIHWNWPGYGGLFCDLSATRVTYMVKVTLPRWADEPAARPELAARWSTYMGALVVHEQVHVEHVVEGYPSVEAAIEGANCLTAELAAQASLLPIRKADADYDAATNHGATQGARFP